MSLASDKELDKILTEKFTNVFRKGYAQVEGFTMPLRYLDLKDEILDLEINEEDVWICSFPKTGTLFTKMNKL